MSQQEIKKFFESKGIHVNSISLLEKGVNRNAYAIQTDNKDYVFKMFSKKATPYINKHIKWLRQAHKIKDLALYPLNARAIMIHEKPCYYYEYFEGLPFYKAKVKNKAYAFGRVVGNFDRIFSKISTTKVKKHLWLTMSPEHINEVSLELLNHKESHFQHLGQYVLDAYSLLTSQKIDFDKCHTQIIHSDLHMGNALYNGKKARVIDLDGLRTDFRAFEPAVFVSYTFVDEANRVQTKVLNQFLDGYQSVIKLNQSEKKALPALALRRKITEFIWLYGKFKDGHFDRAEFDRLSSYTIRNMKAITQKYDKLADIVKR